MYNMILPSVGLYCAAVVRGKGFSHHFFDTIPETLTFLSEQDALGKTVFLAQSTFNSDDSRKQKNVRSVRSFWLDIDCGEDKPYADQKEGFKALRNTCGKANLPMPMVISSGNGLYAYWPLKDDVAPDNWKNVAKKLRKVLDSHGLEADPARTCDTASVLRPVGATHRKDADNPKTVRVLLDAGAVELAAFDACLDEAGVAKGIPKPSKKKRSIDSIDFGIDAPPPSSAYKIADSCAQIGALRDTRGDVDEPVWYASIGILRFTVESPDIIHAWSSGHESYDEDATDAKIAHHIEAGFNPTLCAKFDELNPSKCAGCKHRGEIRSPITLGWVVPKAVEIEEGELQPQAPFTRTEKGLYYDDSEKVIQFYKSDLYVSAVAHDDSVQCAVMTVKHYLKNEGWKEFTIELSSLGDLKVLTAALFNNGVIVKTVEERKLMTAYLASYSEQLQEARRMGKLLCQMGWKELDSGTVFALGNKLFHANGDIEDAALAQNVPDVVRSLHAVGDVQPWADATKILDKPGAEAHAFSLLAGAFAAPLFKFSGYSGAMVSMLGESGVGKTLVGRWALSAYGDPDVLTMLRDDTKNALVSRLGVYGNLPMYIDEITDIDEKELSALVYRITQGRDKVRLTSNIVERASINQWNTLALVSSNSSLLDKLGNLKTDAGAELNRVFQYNINHVPFLDREECSRIYRMCSANYGGIGQEFVKYIVTHADEHQENIDKITSYIDKKTNASSDERFWSAIVGTTLYAGKIASKLGLIQFDVQPLVEWSCDVIREMRGEKSSHVKTGVDVLAQFLDETVNNRLIVGISAHDKRKSTIIVEPRGELMTRIEGEVAYISRPALKHWMRTHKCEFRKVYTELVGLGVLSDTRTVLGAGTHLSGAQVVCWKIKLDHPSLGNMAVQLVESKPSDKSLTIAK